MSGRSGRDADGAGNGADLLLAGMNEQGLAANVAEYYGIPLAALHFFPGGSCAPGGCDWAHHQGG